MIVSKPVNWLSKAMFQTLGNPVELTLETYHEEDSAKGPVRRITAKHSNGKSYQFDIFGDVLGTLIDGFGNDTDAWIGRKIQVLLVNRDGKDIKKVSCMPK